jgi:hypothetical protein
VQPQVPLVKTHDEQVGGAAAKAVRRVTVACSYICRMIAASGAVYFLSMVNGMTQDVKTPAFSPLPGRTIGLLVGGAGPVLNREGRSGPSNVVVFARNHDSYRWIYLSAQPSELTEASLITVNTLQQGEHTFRNVVLATTDALRRRRIEGEYRLVRTAVNSGLGSLLDDSVVATELTAIDGTQEFVSVTQPIRSAIGECKEAISKNQELSNALERLKDGFRGVQRWTRSSTIIPFVTWLPEPREVEVACDGELSAVEATGGIGIVPQRSLPQPELQTEYGAKLATRLRIDYRIDRSGTIRRAEGQIQTSVQNFAPPGGPAPP